MTTTVSQKSATPHAMRLGRVKGVGTALSALSISEHAITGRNVQTFQTRDQEYGYDDLGNIVLKRTFNAPPGGLNTFTVEFGQPVSLDYMEDMAFRQQIFALWLMSAPCGLRSDPFAWVRSGRCDYHSAAKVDSYVPADTSRTGEDNVMVNSVTGTYEQHMIILPLEGSDISPSNAENTLDLNTIFGLTDPLVEGCAPGYLGPDKHLFLAGEAGVGVPAEVFFSEDEGGTWTLLTNQPFGNDADILKGAAKLQLGTGARVLFFNASAGTSGAEASWGDATFGNVAAMAHTIVYPTTTASDLVTAAEWLFGDGVYVGAGQGSANNIAVSTDRGKTYTTVWSGSPVVNAFAKGYGLDCTDVYAVGTAGFIAKRISNQGAFLTLTPPGASAFTAVAIDQLGYIYAGYGSELVVSIDDAGTAGNWQTVYDFGGTFVVKKIFFKKGDSNHIYVVVDDPGVEGQFWHSNNAGGDWLEMAPPTNLGYNDAYASQLDLNKYFVAGDVNASVGVLHAFLPGASGC